jgi:hypothetical protein
MNAGVCVLKDATTKPWVAEFLGKEIELEKM